MKKNKKKAAPSYIIYCLTGFFCLFCIFFLPYIFPDDRPLVSDSYVFGFNNKISILSVLIFICLFYFLLKPINESLPSLFIKNDEVKKSYVSKWSYIIPGILFFISTVLLYCLTEGYSYGEGKYFIKRMELLSIGRSPYKDFEYAYGPVLIYLPFYLNLIINKFGFTLKESYYIFYYLVNIAGLALLGYIINRFNISSFNKNIIFIVIALTSWNEVMGLNYVLLRFLSPLGCIIFIHSTMTERKENKIPILILLSFITTIITLSISPEMGIAYYISLSAYIFHLILSENRSYIICLISHLIIMPLSILYFSKYYLLSVLSFAGGGYNFPVFPSFYMIFYLFSLFYITILELKSLNFTERGNAIILGLIILNISTIPSALGRCDFGHVFFNGLTVLITMGVVIILKYYQTYFTYYIVIFAVMAFCFKIAHFHHSYQNTIIQNARYTIYKKLKNIHLPSRNFSKFENYKDISIPMGCDEELESYLKTTGKSHPEYYDVVVDIFSEEDLKRKFRDIDRSSFLLIPESRLKLSPYDNTEDMQKSLTNYFLLPFTCKPRNFPFQPYVSTSEYICSNYKAIDVFEYYYILKRKE